MKRILVPVVLVLSVAILVSGYLFHRYSISKRNVVEELIAQKGLVNILLAGGNRFDNSRNRFYALLSINPENGKVGITFIPPEFRVGDEMLQNVDFSNDRKVRDAIAGELGIKIPFYIVLYSPDVARAIDLTGGFDIFMLTKKADAPDLPYFAGGNIEYLDGRKVMRYINEPSGSIYRKYDRILDICLTAYYQNRERYLQLVTPELIALLRKTVRTNMQPRELYSAAKMMTQEGDVISTLLPGRFTSGLYQMDDISKEVYNSRFLKRLVIGESGDKNVKVRLLNGTRVPGLARKVRDLLMREGVVVVEFGTADSQDFEKSIIINQKGIVSDSRFVGEVIGITNVHYIIDSSQLHALTVIIGNDLSDESGQTATVPEQKAGQDESGASSGEDSASDTPNRVTPADNDNSRNNETDATE